MPSGLQAGSTSCLRLPAAAGAEPTKGTADPGTDRRGGNQG